MQRVAIAADLAILLNKRQDLMEKSDKLIKENEELRQELKELTNERDELVKTFTSNLVSSVSEFVFGKNRLKELKNIDDIRNCPKNDLEKERWSTFEDMWDKDCEDVFFAEERNELEHSISDGTTIESQKEIDSAYYENKHKAQNNSVKKIVKVLDYIKRHVDCKLLG